MAPAPRTVDSKEKEVRTHREPELKDFDPDPYPDPDPDLDRPEPSQSSIQVSRGGTGGANDGKRCRMILLVGKRLFPRSTKLEP